MNYTIILFLASVTLLAVDLMIGTVYLFLMGISLALACILAFTAPIMGFPVPLWLLVAVILMSQFLMIWQLHHEHSWMSQWLNRLKSPKHHLPDDFDIGNVVKELYFNENHTLIANYQDSFWQAKVLNGDIQEYLNHPQDFNAVITGKDGNVLLIELVELERYLSNGKQSHINVAISKN